MARLDPVSFAPTRHLADDVVVTPAGAVGAPAAPTRDHAQDIGYWAAGGVPLGTGVGVVQLVVQENRLSNAAALNKLPSDPAPTLRLALYRTAF